MVAPADPETDPSEPGDRPRRGHAGALLQRLLCGEIPPERCVVGNSVRVGAFATGIGLHHRAAAGGQPGRQDPHHRPGPGHQPHFSSDDRFFTLALAGGGRLPGPRGNDEHGGAAFRRLCAGTDATRVEHGAVNSIRNLAWNLGWTVGPYLSGLVQQRWGFTPLFVNTAVLYALGIGLTWIFFRPGKAPEPELEPVPAVGASAG